MELLLENDQDVRPYTRADYEDWLWQTARALIRCRSFEYIRHARKMKRGTQGRGYAARALRHHRRVFIEAWNAMPEVKYWPSHHGNRHQGLGRFLKSIRETL